MEMVKQFKCERKQLEKDAHADYIEPKSQAKSVANLAKDSVQIKFKEDGGYDLQNNDQWSKQKRNAFLYATVLEFDTY